MSAPLSGGVTPAYKLRYILEGQPARLTRQYLQENAESIEAALLAGGVAPPGAADLNAVTARVAATERPPGRRVTKTGTQTVTNAWLLLTWENLTASDTAAGAGMWSATNPSRLVAPRAGRYRALLSLIGPTHLQIRRNAAGSIGGGTTVGAATGLTATGYHNIPADELVLAAGDYVEAFAYSTTSVAAGTTGGYVAYFSLTYIGAQA